MREYLLNAADSNADRPRSPDSPPPSSSNALQQQEQQQQQLAGSCATARRPTLEELEALAGPEVASALHSVLMSQADELYHSRRESCAGRGASHAGAANSSVRGTTEAGVGSNAQKGVKKHVYISCRASGAEELPCTASASGGGVAGVRALAAATASASLEQEVEAAEVNIADNTAAATASASLEQEVEAAEVNIADNTAAATASASLEQEVEAAEVNIADNTAAATASASLEQEVEAAEVNIADNTAAATAAASLEQEVEAAEVNIADNTAAATASASLEQEVEAAEVNIADNTAAATAAASLEQEVEAAEQGGEMSDRVLRPSCVILCKAASATDEGEGVQTSLQGAWGGEASSPASMTAGHLAGKAAKGSQACMSSGVVLKRVGSAQSEAAAAVKANRSKSISLCPGHKQEILTDLELQQRSRSCTDKCCTGSSGGTYSSSSSMHTSYCHAAARELCLRGITVTCQGCRAIGACLYISPLLQVLQLQGCGLDDRAVGELVDALKVNSSVRVLVLAQNSVEDIGARALGRLLKLPGCRLKKLNLSNNQIGEGHL